MSESQNDLDLITREKKLMNEKQWVEIDVCQKYLDVYVCPSSQVFQVTNNEVSITKLVQTLMEIKPKLIVDFTELIMFLLSLASLIRSHSYYYSSFLTFFLSFFNYLFSLIFKMRLSYILNC